MMSGSSLIILLLALLVSVPIEAERFPCSKEHSCGCGQSNVEISERIIGGEEAVPFSWPMLVSIRYDFLHNGNQQMHICGGTILTDSYILTAASCLEEITDHFDPQNVTIAAGIHRQSQPRQLVREVDRIIAHPSWISSSRSSEHDIAVLHLSEPLDLQRDAFITRTCLAPQLNTTEQLLQYPSANTKLFVVGWGRKVFYGDNSDNLRQLRVSSIDANHTQCKTIISNPERQFCTGLEAVNTGPCYGDFGGPILQWMNDHWEQVGIASYTADGCSENSAISYTRLAYYRTWIETQMKDNDEFMNKTTTTGTIPGLRSTTSKPAVFYQCDKSDVPCGCGRRSVGFSQANVDNDNYEAIPYSWSMVVSIRSPDQNKHVCSGSMLSDSFILTSATCLASLPSYGLTIIAGLHNRSETTGTDRKVDRVYLHPNYMGILDNYANDVAILHVSEPFDLEHDLYISRTCLMEKDSWTTHPGFYPSPGSKLAVVGWGLMNCQNRTREDLLQQIEIYSTDDLEKNCYILNQHRDFQFCAGLLDIRETVPCIGDPGSPIFLWSNGRWLQVGIASFVFDYGAFRSLSIYTRTVEYNEWIQSIIQNCSAITPSTGPYSTTGIVTPVDYNTTTATKPAPLSYACNRTSTCGCGPVPVVLTPSRVVNGENAMDHSWPMIVSLRRPGSDEHWCGGSILSDRYVLTAAHCLAPFASNPPINVTIAVGMTNLSDPNQIERQVVHIYNHPDYIGPSDRFRHDISVLRLNQSLPLAHNSFLSKTCIHRLRSPTENAQYIKNGTRLSVIGWGTMTPNMLDQPTILQQVEVFAIDNNDLICTSAMGYPELQFCAGLPEGGKDSCQGDSGGPIFQWTGDYWEQVGVVSHGDSCALPGKPGIYTRLSYYYDWISDILKHDNEHLEPASLSETMTSAPVSTTATLVTANRSTNTTVKTKTITTTTTASTSRVKSKAYIHRSSMLIFVLFGSLFRELLQ